jgi:hypothetical protein
MRAAWPTTATIEPASCPSPRLELSEEACQNGFRRGGGGRDEGGAVAVEDGGGTRGRAGSAHY